MTIKIDLHNHTTFSSKCSILSAKELIAACQSAGFAAVCVTEHNTMRGAHLSVELGRGMGFTVIPGQEVTTADGDMLVFGVEEEGLEGITVDALCVLARERGGVLIPAHPYRTSAFSLGDKVMEHKGCFAALEGLNGNCGKTENRRAQDTAKKLGLPCTGGSDAHSVKMAAKYFTTFETDIPIIDSAGLIEALKKGNFSAGMIDVRSGS
ncbi:MAG: hypothetical protein A2Y33_07320 [Spirochaetes bacterium GWF1_51_8]|nr:MAG: hypothetical protein A2Y33_07320 [Spirochaetes bacterium GWF1_51_8]